MAANVMTHYENMKGKEDRKRVLNMNMCLAAFVDPENQIKRKRRRRESQISTVKSHRSSALEGSLQGPDELNRKTSLKSQRSSRNRHDSDSQSEGTDSTQSRRVEEDDNIETFKRAADLLHAALGLEFGGGVVFMDTATSYRSVGLFSSCYIPSQGRSHVLNANVTSRSTSNGRHQTNQA
jgi:hypothetical protein